MSNGVYGEDLARVGVTRKSQSTNVLLVHSELGKVKPRVFAKAPAADFAFGVSKARDREGAKDGARRSYYGNALTHTPLSSDALPP